MTIPEVLILRSPTDPAESSPFEFQSCSQDFMCDQMPGSQTPLHVYHRRRFILDPAQTSVENENGDGSPSAISSDAHSPATRDQLVSVETETEGVRSPCVPPAKCSTEGIVSKCGSYNGCPDGEEPDEGLRSDSGRILDICCIDDSCSSSKLNLDLISVSVRTDGDDTGESSSSGGLVSESLRENMSERDICISIIRSHGLVEIASPRQDSISADDGAMASDQDCLRTCKVCGCSETSCKMLICDQCDDAFHTSCCIPRIKRLPTDEWFCYSCLKKKRKLLKENSSNAAANVSNEDKFGPIANMLKDNKPLKSSVRVGPDYQAEVPDWAGPVIDENAAGEPEETTELEYLSLHGENSNNSLQLSSIGNWIQCQENVEGIEGGICGKWRRAPLFEVQTDDWECFRTVLWDPSHADCSVPQELPTDEVLKQLKYMEMFKPQLLTKKRKLDQIKTLDSEAPKGAISA